MDPADQNPNGGEPLPELPESNAQTFLKAPQTAPSSLTDEVDVGVVGVPFDGGTILQAGARFGPKALREATAGYYSITAGDDSRGEFVNVNTGRTVNWGGLNLRDCGDTPLIPNSLGKSESVIEDYIHSVACRTFPLVLGGDHSITYPSFMGYAKSVEQQVGIIHLDAHNDMHHAIRGVPHQGTMFPRIHASQYGGYENHAMVGIRGYQTREFLDLVDEHNLHVSFQTDIREQGIEACIEEAIAHAGDGVNSVYLTLDIDVVDPAYAPGTGVPKPGGLSSEELLRAADRLGACELIGAMDIVEVAPQHDPTTTTRRGTTQLLGAEAVLTFLEAKFF